MSKCTCDFHHKHPWQRWVKSSKNRLTKGEQKMLLNLMQVITRAWMENSYQKAVDSLRKSKMYTGNAKVQEYCGKVWLHRSDRWARACCVQLYGNWQKVTQNSLQLTIRDLSAVPSYTTICLQVWPLSSGHQNRKLAGPSSSPQYMALYAAETAPGGRWANPDLSHGRENQTESVSTQGKPSDHLPLHQLQKRMSLPNQTVQSVNTVPAKTISCETKPRVEYPWLTLTDRGHHRHK